MKALSVFRSRIATRVPTCPDPLIDQVVLDACIDFCERTLVVKRMLDSFTTTASQAAYSITGVNQQSVAQVMRVWCEDVELVPKSEDGVDTPFQFVATIPGHINTTSRPRFFNETDPGTVQLYPTPDAVYTINARVAMRPTRSATQVEDQLYEDWIEPIVDGALARLYVLPEFVNPTLAQYHAGAYQGGVGIAMHQATKGRTRAQLRVTPVHI